MFANSFLFFRTLGAEPIGELKTGAVIKLLNLLSHVVLFSIVCIQITFSVDGANVA